MQSQLDEANLVKAKLEKSNKDYGMFDCVTFFLRELRHFFLLILK